MIDVGYYEATRQGIQGLLQHYAPEDFQDCIAAAVPRTQQKYARMTAGRESADISKVQIKREEQSAFCNRPLPDQGIVRPAETLIRHALGGVARCIQEVHVRLREVLIQLKQKRTHRKGTSSSSPTRTAA